MYVLPTASAINRNESMRLNGCKARMLHRVQHEFQHFAEGVRFKTLPLGWRKYAGLLFND